MEIKSVRCLAPFMSIQFVSYGFVRSCCTNWTRIGPIGNIYHEKDLLTIWNSDRIQKIRKAVLEDRMSTVCNMHICPHALERKNIVLDEIITKDPNFQYLIGQIKRGETKLDRPPLKILLSDSGECNLSCRMCTSNNHFVKHDPVYTDLLFNDILPKALPFAMRINLSGNGEPLFRKETREFLTNPQNSSLYPNLKIDLVTNGLLLNVAMWEKIKHNRFNSINVSCDAATKETYEAIRCNGRWEVLLDNLKYISELRENGAIDKFTVSYVVLKSNFAEILRFIDVMSEFKPDEILFQRVTGLMNVSENIFFTKDIKAFSVIGRLLHEKQCKQKNVNTLALDFCTEYSVAKTSGLQKANTGLRVQALTIPMRFYYKFRKHLLPVYELYYRISMKLGR